jgi:hypothetical protein
VSAQTVPEDDAVRAARPDGRTIPVNGLTLVRDAYRIDLRSGVLHLLAPFDGETFGAVFLGEGEYRLEPATDAERRHLRLVTGDERLETLTDRFDRLLLLLTDQTGEEMLAHAPVVAGAPDARATEVYEDYLELQRERIQINLHLRIVSDLLNRPDRSDGVFLASDERTQGAHLLCLGRFDVTPERRRSDGEARELEPSLTRRGQFRLQRRGLRRCKQQEVVLDQGDVIVPFHDDDHLFATEQRFEDRLAAIRVALAAGRRSLGGSTCQARIPAHATGGNERLGSHDRLA